MHFNCHALLQRNLLNYALKNIQSALNYNQVKALKKKRCVLVWPILTHFYVLFASLSRTLIISLSKTKKENTEIG